MPDEKTPIGAKVPPKLKDRVDEYQEAEEFVNRSDAIRDLLEDSLDRYENPPTVSQPTALAWIGTFIIGFSIEPGPNAGTGTMLVGIGFILLALLISRSDILDKIRQ